VAKSSKKKPAPAPKSKPKTGAFVKPKKAGKPVATPAAKPAVKPLAKSAVAKASRAFKKPAVAAKTVMLKPVAKAKAVAPVKAKPVKALPVKLAPVKLAPVKAAPAKAAPAKTLPAKIAAKQAAKKTETLKKAPPIVLAIKPAKPSRSSSAVEQKPEPFQMQPAVATNLKPKKSQIGLGVRELEHFADMLLAKRRELVGDMSSMEREALRTGSGSNLSTLPVHMADMGTDNYEQEFTLGLVEKDRNLLREINHALAKIQNGTYGICEGTGRPIGKPRLEVQPWARFSIEYARQIEKNGMGVRTMG
jgi:RNA polymerase-binding protein DksA